MRTIILIFNFVLFAQTANAQTTKLEKELINALYECRADFYELADNYYKLDSIRQNQTQAARERAERAEAETQEQAELLEKQKATTRNRTKQRNAAALSALILIIINLLNR